MPYANLARGWNRQADAARNRVFYRDRPLTAEAYQKWLHRWAVRFVVLSTAKPDDAAVEEAALVAGGLPYLERVWSDDEWTLYEVDRPAPLGIRAGRGALVRRRADHPVHPRTRSGRGPRRLLPLARPGRRVGQAAADRRGRRARREPLAQPCLSGLATDRDIENPRDNWLVLHATEAGVYRIGAPYKMPRGSACT